MERSHFLLSGKPVPLKLGQTHCPLCEGYGYVPEWERARCGLAPAKAVRCLRCDGRGLERRSFYANKPTLPLLCLCKGATQ